MPGKGPHSHWLGSLWKHNHKRNRSIPVSGQEYFYEDYEKIRLVLADNQKKDERDQFILAKKINQGELFGSADIGLDDGFTYEINEDAFMNPEAYLQI